MQARRRGGLGVPTNRLLSCEGPLLIQCIYTDLDKIIGTPRCGYVVTQ